LNRPARRTPSDDRDPYCRVSRRGTRDTFFACNEGESQGNVADRGQAADSVCRRGGPCRRCPQARIHYGQLEARDRRSEEHTSELQSRENLVCRLLLEKKK